jgi:hypothetical protein
MSVAHDSPDVRAGLFAATGKIPDAKTKTTIAGILAVIGVNIVGCPEGEGFSHT